jgi:hypothetical protein
VGAKSIAKKKAVAAFFLLHLFLIFLIHKIYAFAPDEPGYLYTFENLYGSNDPNPQFSSGWLNTPKFFLWIIYLPAKLLSVIGVEPSFAIRLYSIILITACLGVAQDLFWRALKQNTVLRYLPVAIFCVPSVFLWTSTGLREVFLLSELFVFWFAIVKLETSSKKRFWIVLFLSSYALFATKNYIWGIVMCAFLITTLFFILRKVNVKKNLVLLLIGMVAPAISFGATTSISSFDFLTKSNLAMVSERSGDSVFQGSPQPNSEISLSSPVQPGTEDSLDESETDVSTEPITIRGEMTLVLLRNYFVDHPNSLFTNLSRWVGVEAKVIDLYQQELNQSSSLVNPAREVSGSHILTTGKIQDPMSIVEAMVNFLFGPFPFAGELGSIASVIAFESPIWWGLLLVICFLFFRANKSAVLQNEVFFLSALFFMGFVLFSALVEVNLGTSFRHRSILVIPILYASLELIRSRKKE